MKRFRFRLQTLLDMKQRREEELARKVAEKNNEIIRTYKSLQEGRDRLSEFQTEEKIKRATALNVLMLRLSVVHRHALQRDIEDKGRRIAGLKQELQTAVKSLTEAKKERRALEIIRDKKREQWEKDYTQEERKFTDDVSQKGYIRKSRIAAKTQGR
jgi:flagellar FliJ protein